MIDASKLVTGDKIVIRIRADKGSSLAQVEAEGRPPAALPRFTKALRVLSAQEAIIGP